MAAIEAELLFVLLTKRMASDRLGQASLMHSLRDRPLNEGLVDVMTPLIASRRVSPAALLRKDKLPVPLAARIRILACQGVLQLYAAVEPGRGFSLEETQWLRSRTCHQHGLTRAYTRKEWPHYCSITSCGANPLCVTNNS